MRKWNIIGFIFSIITTAFTLWSVAQNDIGEIPLVGALILLFIGMVLLGVDRWTENTKYNLFLITLLWTGYWGFIASGLISMAGLYGFALSFGSGDKRLIIETLMYSYSGAAFLFATLAFTNLVKFIIALFSLPKLGTH